MMLYRPVALNELLLIYRSEMRQFPPHLSRDTIFAPVLNAEYAEQIARDLTTTSGSMAGYLVEFELDDAHARSFQVRQTAARHEELWVPAALFEDFNTHIYEIRLISAYFTHDFVGVVPAAFSLRGRSARDQLDVLRGIHGYSLIDFHGEVTANHEAVFANFPFWEQLRFEDAAPGAQTEPTLVAIRRVWSGAFPSVPLGLQDRRVESDAAPS